MKLIVSLCLLLSFPSFAATIPELISALSSDSKETRQRAGYELARIGAPAIGPLIAVLETGTPTAKTEALRAFGPMRPGVAKEAVPFIIPFLEDFDLRNQELAARALGNIGPEAEASIPFLINLISTTDWWDSEVSESVRTLRGWVRMAATSALSKIGMESFRPLIRAYKSANHHLRKEEFFCALASIQNPDKELEVHLLRVISKDDSSLYLCALEGLALLDSLPESTVPLLLPFISGTPSRERVAATSALGKTPMTESTIQILEVLSRDRDLRVAEAARWALADYERQ